MIHSMLCLHIVAFTVVNDYPDIEFHLSEVFFFWIIILQHDALYSLIFISRKNFYSANYFILSQFHKFIYPRLKSVKIRSPFIIMFLFFYLLNF